MTTSATPNIGVCSVGVYLPEQVRENDHFSAEEIERWGSRTPSQITRCESEATDMASEGTRRVSEAMREYQDDPFRGSTQRRVMGAHELACDMEAEAARRALDLAELAPGKVDFILGTTMVPDYQLVPDVCAVHEQLGLRRDCFTLHVDNVCNSFLMQLSVAEALIKSGAASHGLLVQGSAFSRLTLPDSPLKAWFGDGATAVVVGAVDAGDGLLNMVHRTDGALSKALVLGRPEGRWCDGAPVAYSEDHDAAQDMHLTMTDKAKEVLGECMHVENIQPTEVDYFACHQATAWLPRVAQEHLGFTRARRVDTFSWAGTLSSANLPLVMSAGVREGFLAKGDLVALFSGGTGMTWSGALLRWTAP